jgi:hypothetical protein
MNHASLIKNKLQSNYENKTTITLSWKTHLMQSDAKSPDEILRQKKDAKMKRGRTARNKNKVAKCCTWEAAAHQNPNFEILREKQGAKMKWGRITGNKNKVVKCCTWEVAVDLNPNFERKRQNPHCTSLAAEDETCGCHVTIFSMTTLWLFNN